MKQQPVMTEEQILTDASVKATLGKKEYEIKQLKLGKAMEWRAKHGPILSQIMAAYGAEANSPEVFMQAFVNCPELMYDAVFDYCPNLPKEKIMSEDEEFGATEQQMTQVFVTIVGFAFGPFLGGALFLNGLKKQMERSASELSEPSSRLQ